jgi:hypothetical protein
LQFELFTSLPMSDPIDLDFVVCPHCWQVNPRSRYCARCLADMTTRLQESGGRRFTTAAQSPMPVRVRSRLSTRQRWLLFGAVVLFGVAQVVAAFTGGATPDLTGRRAAVQAK